MAWNLTQGNSKDTNTVGSDTLAFLSNNDPSSEGNHVIIVSGRFGAAGATLTCADSAGNTYTPATAQASNSFEIDSGGSGADCYWMFYCINAKPNTANTVTVTIGSGGTHRFTWSVAEFAPGAGATVTLDAGPVTKQFNSTNAFNVGPITTTGANDLVFIGLQADQVQSSWTNGGAWTAFQNTSNNGFAGTDRAVGQYQLGVAAGSYTGSMTASGATSTGSGIIIAFTATGGGGGNPAFEDDSFSMIPGGQDSNVTVW